MGGCHLGCFRSLLLRVECMKELEHYSMIAFCQWSTQNKKQHPCSEYLTWEITIFCPFQYTHKYSTKSCRYWQISGFTFRTVTWCPPFINFIFFSNQCSKHFLQIGKGVRSSCIKITLLIIFETTLLAFHIFNTLILSLENHWQQINK